jgi:hypothetical protein
MYKIHFILVFELFRNNYEITYSKAGLPNGLRKKEKKGKKNERKKETT